MIDQNEWAALVKELKDNAARLGLTWDLATATVDDPTIPTVIFDSDAAQVVTPVVNIGNIPIAGDRVWVAPVPPAGNYMIGRAPLPDPAHMGVESTNAAFAAGTTSSVAYANLPGAPTVTLPPLGQRVWGDPTVTLPKAYTATRIRVDLHATCTSTLANTSVRFAVLINAVDVDIAQLVINPASTHLQVSGTLITTLASAGSIPVVGRWRRVAGGGVVTTGTDDWFSMTVQEVP